jgi:hypothetical protein
MLLSLLYRTMLLKNRILKGGVKFITQLSNLNGKITINENRFVTNSGIVIIRTIGNAFIYEVKNTASETSTMTTEDGKPYAFTQRFLLVSAIDANVIVGQQVFCDVADITEEEITSSASKPTKTILTTATAIKRYDRQNS